MRSDFFKASQDAIALKIRAKALLRYRINFDRSAFFASAQDRGFAWKLAMSVLALAVLASAVSLSVKYRRKFTYTLAAPRGTMHVQADLGATFQQAGEFLEQNGHKEDFVAVVPEGTSLDFLWERRNPLRDL